MCVLCASVSVCWCVCVCVMVCVYCASFAGHYLYSANLPPCDYCDWLPFWLLLSRFARLSCLPSLSFHRSLSLCHTLSFCWWHSSCTFAFASCALHTVLHFIVYCGCPTRLSAWHSPTWHCSRRRFWLWLLLTPSTTAVYCIAPLSPPSSFSPSVSLFLCASVRMTAKC